MKIELHCRCGGQVTLDDPRCTFADGDKDNPKGRRFRIEVMADEWLFAHARCLPPTPTEDPKDE